MFALRIYPLSHKVGHNPSGFKLRLVVRRSDHRSMIINVSLFVRHQSPSCPWHIVENELAKQQTNVATSTESWDRQVDNILLGAEWNWKFTLH